MRRNGSWLAWTLALSFVLGMGLSGTARALSMTPDPRDFSIATMSGTASGEITLVGTSTGLPTNGSVLSGTIGGSDVALVFEATLAMGSDSLDEIGVGLLDTVLIFTSPTVTSAGVITGTGDESISGVTASGSTRIFAFSGTLDAEETSQQFFVSYASVETDGTVDANFMISPSDGTSDVTVSSTIVPEPSLALLGGAAVALSLVWRRTRRA